MSKASREANRRRIFLIDPTIWSLKPANIKIRPDGTVKVLDFGLAKASAPVGDTPHVSQSPTIATPAMMTVV